MKLKKLLHLKAHKGFSLIEVLLSVALVAILAATVTPVYQSLQVRNDLQLAASVFAQTVRRAQVLSRAVMNDAPWGVRATNGAITLFRADDPTFDELFLISKNIMFSGSTTLVFSEFSGELSADASTTLASSLGETVVIDINTKGMVSY